ncbi:alpha-1,2-mannosyltransferase [Coprinopsis marcescibilis]|uniref:Alpha-1,2-mannosyltransferase n=1 Tax=Coprinopsis marcescibilis TaxID=230819 RepID=A0A5C3KQA5_COPMA|nr:alpha-1,2-mannosyltransferase [Coprinopsis marcescibilis]
MNTPSRYILLALFLIISLHYLLAFTHESYGRATSLAHITEKLRPYGPEVEIPKAPPAVNLDEVYGQDGRVDRKANATFVVLCRNSDLSGTLRSVREMEDRFNRYHQYPYVFLNEEEFTEEFKERISVLTSAKTEFGVIPHDHWYQPDSIDEDKAKANRDQLVKDKVIYGGSVSYRNMCRFNSGFFFRHPLMLKYRWYWRIEPDVHFHCNINHDPFLYMQENNKSYAFTITMYEYRRTIPTLWDHVKDFVQLHPEHIAKDNALGFMSPNGVDYNLCHFWSNFEIADMEFWRGPAYTDFFNYLDEKGGFYYERWGDAPVHSIAAALFLNKNQIHFFDEIGYEHSPYTHCPKLGNNYKDGKCSCDPKKSFDYDGYSCMSKWDEFMGLPDH